ncbi:hypothetical protein KAR91_20295 [Candidatus Pacearchaeota archaeon]|nr:hypothetical protein [Candidatus Pacearchaeota archaeon]
MKNTSGFTPCWYCVLVKLKTVDTVSKGGIVLPKETVKKEQLKEMKGRLVAQGKLAFRDNKGNPTNEFELGDDVFVQQYAGRTFEGNDGETYQVMNDTELHGKVEEL